MLTYSDYVSDIPDLSYDNFAQFLDGIAREYPDSDAVLHRAGKQREFTRLTFSRFAGECRRIARGLLAAGLVKGDRVALWAENRPEWMIAWMGAVIAGLVIVPIDFLISEKEALNIIKITKAKALFYSGGKRLFATLLPLKGVSLSSSVCISPDDEDSGRSAEFAQFGAGAEALSLPPLDDVKPDDPASIVFTSGTTGLAKGVTLSHKGIIANASAALRILTPSRSDVFLDVLPLHHTYPTTCSFISPLSFGIPTVIADKIVGKVVVDDIRDAGVTHVLGVPLLFEKMMAAIDAGYKKLPAIIRLPLNALRAVALSQAKKGNPEFASKAFAFIRKKAGLLSVKLMVAGGGALNPKTADFFDSLGFNIVHGYGMSENGPLISVNTPRYKRNVSVGLPVIYTEVKIIDPSPEGIGEIAVKSPSLMLGYFENEEATREVFDADGWLLTGDLGYRDEDGFIYIKGRKKNLIVSAGGKNIYPEEIEVCFSGSRAIAEILIVGRKDADGGEQIFAVTVPDYEAIQEDNPGKETDDGFVLGLIKAEIEDANRSLPVYKKISDFAVRKEPFEKNAQQKIKRFLYKEYERA